MTTFLQVHGAMADRFEFERIVTMDTDHSPFLSRPDELATHLAGVADLVASERCGPGFPGDQP